MPRSVRLSEIASALVLLVLGTGCRMSAPLYSWEPPLVTSAVGQRVALPPLAGPLPLAEVVGEMTRGQPPQGPLSVAVVDPTELEQASPIRLTAGTEGAPSDLAVLDAARRSGADLLLSGEVLSRSASPDAGTAASLPDGRLAVAWKVIDVPTGQQVGGRPIAVSVESAAQRHPDLFLVPRPETQRLATAAGREAWQLLVPHIRPGRAKLALPWVTPGAARIRQGNAYAHAGRWPEAERQWESVLEDYPNQHAAIHNLAVAAVARQDFETARQRAAEALRLRGSNLYEQTLAWVEHRQRQYHAAFNLPDPPGGWRLAPPEPAEPEPVEVLLEPRGWTLWGWLTQPIPL